MDLLLQLLATGLVVGSLYALCALGWGLIYGTTLHFHVAHGAVFSLAAYFAYVGQKLLHLPLARRGGRRHPRGRGLRAC